MTGSGVRAVPEGLHTITPQLIVSGAPRAAEWYTHAFGAEERSRLSVGSGKLLQAELRLGNSVFMIADELPEMGIVSPRTGGGNSIVLTVYRENVEELWRKAVDAGASIVHPLQDQFWGDRHGQIIDPFGHRWSFARHVRDVPDEEITEAAANMFQK
jgi:PhnB protein